jgi:hypothetical protein
LEPQDPQAHEPNEELMAGYVLRSLSGEDAREADRLLSEHVPGCAGCRATLLAFTDTVAELGLAADPLEPPETLLPRLHRELEPRTARSASARWAGAAAGIAAVLLASGLAVSQGLRAGDLTAQRDRLVQAVEAAAQPDANALPLAASDPGGPEPVTSITAPDGEWLYLVGEDVPSPPRGWVYRVWLSEAGEAVFAGQFLPDPGVTVRRIRVDPGTLDSILITVERADSEPTTPGEPVWGAAA